MQFSNKQHFLLLVETRGGAKILFEFPTATALTTLVSEIQRLRRSLPSAPVSKAASGVSAEESRPQSAGSTTAPIQCQVHSPQLVSDSSGDSVVVFAIDVSTTVAQLQRARGPLVLSMSPPAPSVTNWRVHRRYRAFEQLRQALVQAGLEPPLLPPKSLLNSANPTFLAQRAAGLTQFLQQLLSPRLREAALAVPDVVVFLCDDSAGGPQAAPSQVARPVELGSNGWWKAIRSGMVDAPLLSSLERQMTSILTDVAFRTSASPPSLSPLKLAMTPLEEDVHTIRQLLRKWEATSTQVSEASSTPTHLQSLPFHKYCVLLLGATSSGKSAFCNWLFGASVKKSADNQQDTTYTLVEVVDEESFYNLVGKPCSASGMVNRKLLSEPIVDPETDGRNGEVFFALSPYQTRMRYEQLPQSATQEGFGSIDQLFTGILINKRYLDPNSPQFDLACRCLVIDSPGFDSVAPADVPTKFLLSIKVLSVLYQLADTVLFFVQAGNITTQAASQLPMLELTVLLGSHNGDAASHLMRTLETSPTPEDSLGRHAIRALIDLFDPPRKEPGYRGSLPNTAVWSKIFFIVSKVDIVWFNAVGRTSSHRAVANQLFELGVMFATHLRKLAPPTPDSVLTIGVPSEQKARESEFLGDLELLGGKLARRAVAVPYETRLEQRIQELARQLVKTIQGSWSRYSPGQLFGSDLTTLENVLKRSLDRMASRSS